MNFRRFLPSCPISDDFGTRWSINRSYYRFSGTTVPFFLQKQTRLDQSDEHIRHPISKITDKSAMRQKLSAVGHKNWHICGRLPEKLILGHKKQVYLWPAWHYCICYYRGVKPVRPFREGPLHEAACLMFRDSSSPRWSSRHRSDCQPLYGRNSLPY